MPASIGVGARNVDFVRRFLALEGLPVIANRSLREKDHLSALAKEPVSGDVELFGH